MPSVYQLPLVFDGKVCRKCAEWKPFPLFPLSTLHKDGRYSYCKVCKNQLSQERAHRPKPPIPNIKTCNDCGLVLPITSFQRKAAILDGYSNQCRTCRAAARRLTETKEQQHDRYVRRRQDLRVVLRTREHNNAYYAKNRVMLTVKKFVYRLSAREKIRDANRAWRLAHPEADHIHFNKRRAAKRQAGGSYTAREWRDLCERYGNKCLSCGSTDKLTVDHIKPLSRGGRNDIANIQPLCITCNRRKHTSTIDYRF